MNDDALFPPLDALLREVATRGRVTRDRWVDGLLDAYNAASNVDVRAVIGACITATAGMATLDVTQARWVGAHVVAAHAAESASANVVGRSRRGRRAGTVASWAIRGRRSLPDGA